MGARISTLNERTCCRTAARLVPPWTFYRFDAPLIVETIHDVRLEAGIDRPELLELELIHADAVNFDKRHHPSRDVMRLSKGLSKTKLIGFGASAVEAADPWTKLRLLGAGLQARPTKRSSGDPPGDWKGGRRRSEWGPGSTCVMCDDDDR